MSSSSENTTSNEDIQKTLRKLSSCITLSAVSSNPASKSEESDSSDDQEGSREGSRSPEENSDTCDKNKPGVNSAFIKDWSKRCISISYAKKDSKAEEKFNTAAENEAPPPSKESPAGGQVNNFKCSFCKIQFKSQNELVRHILTCKKLGGSISFADKSANKKCEEEEESSAEDENTSDEEEDDPQKEVAKTISALKQKSSLTATVSGSRLNPTNLNLNKESLSTIATLPKGISISTSCSLSHKSKEPTQEKEPIVVATAKEPTVVAKAKEPTVVAKAKEPTAVAKAKEPTVVAKAKEPTLVTKAVEPTVVTKARDPTVATKTEKQSNPVAGVSATAKKSKPTDSYLELQQATIWASLQDSEEEDCRSSDEEYIPPSRFNPRVSKARQTSKAPASKKKAAELAEKYHTTKPAEEATVFTKKCPPKRDSFEFIGFTGQTSEPFNKAGPSHIGKQRRQSISKKSTAKKRIADLPCVPCNIENIGDLNQFYSHHSKHIKKASIRLKRLPSGEYSSTPAEESHIDNNSETETCKSWEEQTTTAENSPEITNPNEEPISTVVEDNPISPSSNSSSKSESGSLRLTFKISEVEEPGGNKKRKTVSILNPENMQEPQDKQKNVVQPNQNSVADSSNILFPESPSSQAMDTTSVEKPLADESPFPADPNESFGNAADAPTSSYEPQFESFTGDWLNEYESGERIAAAMSGAVPPVAGSENMMPGQMYDPNQPLPPQGSFEQLCLNDSYTQNQGSDPITSTQSHNMPYNNAQAGDIFSDLNYLGNAERQVNSIGQSNDFNMNGSNSSTPNSITSHPSPGDSFRSLATSPQGTPSPMSGTISPTTSPFPPHGSPLDTGLMPNTASGTGETPPLSMTQEPSQEVTAPRLTIANNLMPTTTASLTPLIGVYNQQQWPAGNNNSSYSQSYIQNSMGPPGTIRPIIPGLPSGYRPSPRPRVRGRPPLMDSMQRPMMRGPGRPPGPNSLNGTRGGLSQRGSSNMYGNNARMNISQKRPMSGSPNHSPAKSMRREDINVPSRQKDNDCQIIAVANRNEGMPVISNIQGNSRESRAPSSSVTGGDSTIHLSDSITLSVRPNITPREPAKGSKGGDAGVVANLLASRGITVTPAAGEKEAAAREERRLPSASDLNLSSAISVHPPSRDRDGFAVPQTPQNRSATNDSPERPVRPPTVDLTQDINSRGSPAARLQCSQCERTFPTSTMLADHAKVHQSQSVSRMPYKCHLCNAGFSAQKGQQAHYQQFHQLHLSAGDLAIPIVDVRNAVTQRKMQQLGVRAFLPLTNLQNRGAGGVVGIPILTLENINNGQMSLQQWGITDVMSLGPPKTFNSPRPLGSSPQPRMPRPRMPGSL